MCVRSSHYKVTQPLGTRKSHLATLKQSLVMGKWVRYFSFSTQVLSTSCRPMVEEQVDMQMRLKVCPLVAPRLQSVRRPTGLGTAARDGAWCEEGVTGQQWYQRDQRWPWGDLLRGCVVYEKIALYFVGKYLITPSLGLAQVNHFCLGSRI